MKLKELTQEQLDILVEKAKLYDKIAVLTKDSFGMINNTSEIQKVYQEPKKDYSVDIDGKMDDTNNEAESRIAKIEKQTALDIIRFIDDMCANENADVIWSSGAYIRNKYIAQKIREKYKISEEK